MIQKGQGQIGLLWLARAGYWSSFCESGRNPAGPQSNDEGISMSKDQKRTDTKNQPKLSTKEKKAKKAAKAAKKAGETGLGILK